MSVCDIFSRALPEYLAIGMPYELFWEGDVWLAAAYRKANRIRRDQANFDAYLQGTYFYEALIRVAPALHAFNKNPRPEEWIDQPYELRPGDRKENIAGESTMTKGEANGLAFMMNFAAMHNAKRLEKTVAKGDAE